MWVVSAKARRKETTRKTKTIWMHNIKMDLRGMKWSGVSWSCRAQDRDQWMALVKT
jgi:hypothetical protein